VDVGISPSRPNYKSKLAGRQRKILLPGHFRSGAGTRLGVASRGFSKEFSVVFRFATGTKSMIDRSTVRRQVVEEFLGDVAPLAAQIGSAEGLLALSSGISPKSHRVTDLPSLREFLRDYRSLILIPLEWPAICRAHGHASRYEIRELIDLDLQLAREPLLQSFATASQRVGKTQLKRLRPLRDQRLVQRYRHAVQSGEAHAWHTLVYGLILSLYSLPLRQGLLSYAQQTTRGFVRAAADQLRLPGTECEELMGEVDACFPKAVTRLLSSADGSVSPIS